MSKVLVKAWPDIQAAALSTAIVVSAVVLPALIMYMAA